MIIVCPSCSKNFNVRDDQIPDKGRLLQCSNCKHEWFYTKNTIPLDNDIDELIIESDIQSERNNILYAEGNVTVSYQGKYLKSDKLIYDKSQLSNHLLDF